MTPEPGTGDQGLEDLRARILHRFEAWLHEALAASPTDASIAPEILAELSREEREPGEEEDRAADRHALWSALTALTQEVKLQGRAFRQLHDALAERAPAREDEDPDRRLIELLCDVRDRLERGLGQASLPAEAAAGWRARLARLLGVSRDMESARDAVDALARGYRMGLDRIDEALGELGVTEIPSLGQPFDPSSMSAVDVRWLPKEDRPDREGVVVEVCRPGYYLGDEVLRPALVMVTRRRERDVAV